MSRELVRCRCPTWVQISACLQINDAEVSLSASATAKYKGDADALDESATAALGNYLVYLVQVTIQISPYDQAESDNLF